MVKPAETRTVDIAAYDGMVVLNGLSDGPLILSAGSAEEIGYQLSAAAFAASTDAVRTWSGSAHVVPSGRRNEPTRPEALPASGETRSFMPPMDEVSGQA